MKIDGRCHCGYVRFEAEADPEMTTICNCTDCQTMSGAPLRAIVATRPGTFVLLSGKPTEYRKTADSGNVRLQAFCPHCGTPIYATSTGDEPKAYNVRLGSCANEMNWCHAGRYLFARGRHGSTTSTRSRNSTGRRIDLADGLRTGAYVSYLHVPLIFALEYMPLVLHEWLQKLPPFTLRLTTLSSYHTCKWFRVR